MASEIDLIAKFLGRIEAWKLSNPWTNARVTVPLRELRAVAEERAAKDKEIAELREANAALIAERSNLIATKREQLAQLQTRAERAELALGKVADFEHARRLLDGRP